MSKKWSRETIKEGFERFLKEHGRLPLAMEIEKLDYLPNRKYIERNFGGLEKFRGDLGYTDTHFGKGKYRSEIAKRVNTNGRNIEIALEKLLKNKFGEVFVHTEKIFDNTKNRVDFYVYSPSGNFGVDVFGTETMANLQTNMSAKLGKYTNFKEPLYFVVASGLFPQRELDGYVSRKVRLLPSNAQIVANDSFLEIIRTMQAWPDPTVANSAL